MQLLMGSATSTRALLLTFAIAIVVLIFGTSLLLYDLRQTDIQQAKYQLTGLSRILAEQTSKSLESISLVMRSAEERLSDPLGRRLDLDDNPVTFLLKARASGLPQLRSLFILDQRGNLANSSLADLSETAVPGGPKLLPTFFEQSQNRVLSQPTNAESTGSRMEHLHQHAVTGRGKKAARHSRRLHSTGLLLRALPANRA